MRRRLMEEDSFYPECTAIGPHGAVRGRVGRRSQEVGSAADGSPWGSMPHGDRGTTGGAARGNGEFPPPGVKPCGRRRRVGKASRGRKPPEGSATIKSRLPYSGADSRTDGRARRRAGRGDERRPRYGGRGRTRPAGGAAARRGGGGRTVAGGSTSRTRSREGPPPGSGPRPSVSIASSHPPFHASGGGRAADVSAEPTPLTR